MKEMKKQINEIRKAMTKLTPVEAMAKADKICNGKRSECSCSFKSKKDSEYLKFLTNISSGVFVTDAEGTRETTFKDAIKSIKGAGIIESENFTAFVRKIRSPKDGDPKTMTVEEVFEYAKASVPGLTRDDFAKVEMRLHKGGLFINPVLKTEDPDYDDFEYEDVDDEVNRFKPFTDMFLEQNKRFIAKVFKTSDEEFLHQASLGLRDIILYRDAAHTEEYSSAISKFAKLFIDKFRGVPIAVSTPEEFMECETCVELDLHAFKNILSGNDYTGFRKLGEFEDKLTKMKLLFAGGINFTALLDDLNDIIKASKDSDERDAWVRYKLRERLKDGSYLHDTVEEFYKYLVALRDDEDHHHELAVTYCSPKGVRMYILDLLTSSKKKDLNKLIDVFEKACNDLQESDEDDE